MDAKAAKLLEKRMEREPNYFMKLIPEMEKQQSQHVGWLNLRLEEASGAECGLVLVGFWRRRLQLFCRL